MRALAVCPAMPAIGLGAMKYPSYGWDGVSRLNFELAGTGHKTRVRVDCESGKMDTQITKTKT